MNHTRQPHPGCVSSQAGPGPHRRRSIPRRSALPSCVQEIDGRPDTSCRERSRSSSVSGVRPYSKARTRGITCANQMSATACSWWPSSGKERPSRQPRHARSTARLRAGSGQRACEPGLQVAAEITSIAADARSTVSVVTAIIVGCGLQGNAEYQSRLVAQAVLECHDAS